MKRKELDTWFRNDEKVIKYKGKIINYYRYLVIEYIGHEIPEGYTVHHINFNHKDNRLENLMLLPTPLHVWVHRCKGTQDLFVSNLDKFKK